jgi:hypothetical protein
MVTNLLCSTLHEPFLDTVAAEAGYHQFLLFVLNRLCALEELRFRIISFHIKAFDMNCFTSLQIYLCVNLSVLQ